MASPKKTEPTTAIVTANLPDFDATATEVAVKPRALIVVSDGSEEMEVLTLSDLLTLGGMHVTLAALGRKRTNVVQGCFGLRINADQSIEESSFGTFELIVLPGVCLDRPVDRY
jgi:putative intracellular protease/amidase